MPIYPYVCTECGHEFDALQKISDDPLSECPACGKSALRKRLAAPAFKLKGTGWYETDFKNTGKKTAEEKSGKDGKDKDAKSGDTGKKEPAGKQGDSGTGAKGGSGTASDGKTKSAAAGKED